MEIEELNLQLRLKDEQLKKSKEDNQFLLKRIVESKESKLPVAVDNNTVCIYVCMLIMCIYVCVCICL